MRRAILIAAFAFAGCGPGARQETPPQPEAPTPVFYQEATWSPDGTMLLLSRYEGDRYRIYRIDADGSGLTRLTEGPDYWTSWSPDGARFAFHSGRTGDGEIWIANADGTGAAAVTRHPAKDTTPAWSPDGSRIAFVSDRGGHYQLHIMDADGSGQRRLSEGTGEEYNPTWSPDGTHLVFYATVNEEDWVEVIGADGSGRTRVARGVFPSWSPDGGRILYDREDTIFTCAPDGSDERALVSDGFAGRWSPDGSRVAFVRGNWPASEIYIVDADGTGLSRLTPPPDIEEAVLRFMAAFNDHNSDGPIGQAAEEIVWLTLGGETLTVETRGRKELRSAMDGRFRSKIGDSMFESRLGIAGGTAHSERSLRV